MEQAKKMISFSSAVGSYWKHIFNWKGRATRGELWFSLLFIVLVYYLSLILSIDIIRLLLILTAIPGILSLNVRRLHDMGKSGSFLWKILFYALLGIIGILLCVMLLKVLLIFIGFNPTVIQGFSSAIFVIGGFLLICTACGGLWASVLFLGFFPSEKNDNQYGSY
ncbi:MAG: DUF805 domain-containing protein [Alphaproteobacteria bacterium]|nr:DUF805 domain-containing protein [Alphaproteobacteria bacterium]